MSSDHELAHVADQPSMCRWCSRGIHPPLLPPHVHVDRQGCLFQAGECLVKGSARSWEAGQADIAPTA